MSLRERHEHLDKRSPRSAASPVWSDKEILQIADGTQAPGVRMENVIGQPDWFATWPECKKAPDQIGSSGESMRCQTPSVTILKTSLSSTAQ
jgi:hypothetical protein